MAWTNLQPRALRGMIGEDRLAVAVLRHEGATVNIKIDGCFFFDHSISRYYVLPKPL